MAIIDDARVTLDRSNDVVSGTGNDRAVLGRVQMLCDVRLLQV